MQHVEAAGEGKSKVLWSNLRASVLKSQGVVMGRYFRRAIGGIDAESPMCPHPLGSWEAFHFTDPQPKGAERNVVEK